MALWLTEPDGGLELAGQAGFGAREASRWRRIHPDMRTPAAVGGRRRHRDLVARGRRAGPAGHGGDCTSRCSAAGRAAPGQCSRCRGAGATLGAMEICWPGPLGGFRGPLRRQLAALAEVAAQALGTRLPARRAGRRPARVLGIRPAGRPAGSAPVRAADRGTTAAR